MADKRLNYTAEEINEILEKADTMELPTKISQLINDSEYITENELDNKGFLTEHQDISNKADKSELHTHNNKSALDNITSEKINEWDNKSDFSGDYNDLTNKPTIPTKTSQLTNDSNFLTSVPSEYITESELNSKGYLTQHQDISNKADKSELHTHNNKSALDNITSEKINEWDNKSDFSGDYNDLTNKPNVPTKISQLANDSNFLTSVPSEYITESELNSKGYLTQHQDISNKLDKNFGAANVGRMLVVGSDGNIILMDVPSGGGVTGDITGTVDESNNIILSGNLADGTYVLKYENEDGTYSDVGTLVVGAIEPTPEPFPGNLFVLDTTKLNTRFSSSGTEKDQNGVWLSDFIPFDINVHHTLYVKNAIMKRDVTSQPGASVVFFDENKAYLNILYCSPAHASYNNWAYKISDDYYKVVLNVSEIMTSTYWPNIKYIKVSGVESEAGNVIVKNDIKDVIISLNTPIEDEDIQEPTPDTPVIVEGNLFDLDAVQLNTKISGTSGTISTQNGAWLTDLIPINITEISTLYVKNAMMRQDDGVAAPSPLLTFHDSDGALLGCLRCNGAHASYQQYVEIISENYTKIDFTHTILTSSPWYSNIKYMRVNGVENPNGTAISSKNDIADVIIKINEPIE